MDLDAIRAAHQNDARRQFIASKIDGDPEMQCGCGAIRPDEPHRVGCDLAVAENLVPAGIYPKRSPRCVRYKGGRAECASPPEIGIDVYLDSDEQCVIELSDGWSIVVETMGACRIKVRDTEQ